MQVMSSSSSPRVRDNSLDFARGIAILMVMRWHTLIPAPKDRPTQILDWAGSRFGWAGVDAFFVLSGFLIGGLLMREALNTSKIDVRRFLLRRGFKLWPAYFVYIVVAGLIVNHRPFMSIVPNLFHLQNYLGTPLSQTWSLAVEEHFYILLAAVLAWMCVRKSITFENILRLCVGVFAFCFIARVISVLIGQNPTQIQWQTHTRIDTLMLGILLAALYRYYPEKFRRLGEQKILLSLGLIATIFFLGNVSEGSPWMSIIGYDIAAVGSACGLVLLFSSLPGIGILGKARTTYAYHLVAQIGFYSYGIYLWHRVGAQSSLIIAKRLPYMNETLKWYVCTASYVIIAVAVGVVSTKLIELPFLAIRDRKIPSDSKSLAYVAEVPTSEA